MNARINSSEEELDPELEQQLTETYTELHEGEPPDKFVFEKPVRQPKWYVTLGTIPEFSYQKKTAEGLKEDPLYRHEVELPEHMRPVYAMDDQGKLHILNQQHIKVTTEGITDMRHKRTARANPLSKISMEKTKRIALSVGSVGLIAAVTSVGLEMLASKLLAPGGMLNLTTPVNPYLRAAGKAAIGVAGAVALEAFDQRTAAAGVGAGGVASGALDAYATWRAANPSQTPSGLPMPMYRESFGQPGFAYQRVG